MQSRRWFVPLVTAVFFSAAIISAASLLARAWRKTHVTREAIKVTGLAKKDFVSDLIVWRGSFSRKAPALKEAYAALKVDAEQVKRYLAGKGVPERQIVLSSVDIEKDYEYITNANGSSQQIFRGYILRQQVQIESKEVDKIETVSREVTELIDAGVELTSGNPEYYYTGLAALKIQMLAEATKDARLRAEKIAANAGSELGRLRNGDMGVFQITAQNSAEEYSWGGAFNTSSKNKTASITVSLEFSVD